MKEEEKKLVLEAIETLKRGDVDDGIVVLERLVDPKFESIHGAQFAYMMRMDDKAKSPIHDYFTTAALAQAA